MTDSMIIFSPTGGTKRVCSLIAEQLQREFQIVDLLPASEETKVHRFGPSDLCILAVPSFGGRVPSVVVERIGNIQADHSRCVLVTTFGNRAYDDTLLELQDLALASGFVPIAAIAAVTQHSIFSQYGKGRPNEEDEEELRKFASLILPLLSQEVQDLKLPGNHLYRSFSGVPLKPKVSANCTHCLLCAQSCPVEAIDRLDPEKLDEKKCITCMHCVSICPNRARYLNPVLLGLAGATGSAAFKEAKKNELYLMGQS